MTMDFVGKHLFEAAQWEYTCLCACIYFHFNCRLSGISLEMKGCEEHCLSILGFICF